VKTGIVKAALGCVLMLSGVAHASEPAERRLIIDEAVAAMHAEDFERVERSHVALLKDMGSTGGGALKVKVYDESLRWALNDDFKKGESGYQHWLEVTRGWSMRYPASPLAQILYARMLAHYAGYFRGTGYANKVPELAWKPYRENLEKAARQLKDHADVASVDPLWHLTMLDVGRGLGWPLESLTAVLDDGVRKYPGDYRLYQKMVESLLPKWGGSAEALDAFINWAEKMAPAGQGAEFYARLYDIAETDQYGASLYRDSKVDWKYMKRGLEDWSRHFPSTWTRQIYASHACKAGDKATAARLLKEPLLEDELAATGAQAGRLFEQCKRWADTPDPAPAAPEKGV
jgi:hypothetical protein